MTWSQIASAARLLENERGTIHKDWGGRLPIALVFPNTYHLGMSSLAVHTLYRLWNDREDIVCERVFADSILSGRTSALPLSLESGLPLDYFPVVAFSVTYELDYFNVAALLRAAGIALRAVDRGESDPLVIAGGPALSANPEPLAPLLDAMVIGEVEPIFDLLTDVLHLVAEGRQAVLAALSRVPGIYVPHQHPGDAATLRPVVRQWLHDLDSSPTHSVLFSPDTEFADMGLLEIARGCGRGCRFCLAGHSYRPPRHRSLESLLAQARDLVLQEERLGLVSAAVSDYPNIDALVTELRGLGARLTISSMRVNPLSETLIRALAESGTHTLTIAPEAGSERLRRAIHKTQSEDDVLRAVELAARYGLQQIKLYFMLGLPGEEQDDVEAIVALALACARRFPRQVTVNITPFVPKAHTPFQRMAQAPARVVRRRLNYLERELQRRNVMVKSESPAWTEIQGALARGDRRVSEALLSTERVALADWRKALVQAGLSADELLAERPAEMLLPWDFIHFSTRQA
jgi:radical SAM superfamily enzyme YgiQ (UPF0313 family)